MARSLATRTSAAVTSRTCATPPVGPSTSVQAMAWIESMMTELRADVVDVAEHRRQVGLVGHHQAVTNRPGTVGPEPDLAGRLLATRRA